MTNGEPPRITIVTPSLDQARFLPRTLDSVHGQGIEGLEHLVFDGGSRDGSRDVLAARGDRLRWWSGPDRGQSHAVNKGFATGGAGVFGWLNSDDLYAPGALAAVLAAFDADPTIDILYGDADYVDEEGRFLAACPVEDWSPERLLFTCFLAQPAVFLRRRVLERCGLLDESLHYAMDYEYWLRAAAAGMRWARLPMRLASCRVHPAAKTSRGRRVHNAESFEARRRHARILPEACIREFVQIDLAERGLDPRRHPALHRLVAVPRALAVATRYSPGSIPQLLRWQAGFLARWRSPDGHGAARSRPGGTP